MKSLLYLFLSIATFLVALDSLAMGMGLVPIFIPRAAMPVIVFVLLVSLSVRYLCDAFEEEVP